MPKGSDLLVASLENEGVEYIFGVPGEENLDVLESLRSSSIKLVLTRHEQGAAFMAATHGRLTGKPGVCLTTLGPGALNLTTGAAYAHLGAMPMVMITGQKGIMSSRQARFQIVDVVSAFRPLTKMSRQIVGAATIPTIVRDAFRVAMEERPGPVLLELPEDIAGEDAPDLLPIPLHPIEIPVAHRAAMDRAAAMILAAKRPLIMLGAAASRPRSTAGLAGFVRRTQIPYFTTQMGKGTVPGGSALYMGTTALSERDYVHEAIEAADLIVAIGHDTIEKPPFIMGPGGPQVIHVSYTPANVDQVYFPHAEVVGDLGPSLELLADRIEGRLPRAGALLPMRDSILSRIMDRATEDRFPLTPQRLVHDVRQVIPPDGIVALDNGMYKIWFARNYRTYVANTLLLDNALATMGAGLPSAMMAAMLNPGRRVMAVCGDGGFMMNSQEMETAVRLRLNLVVLVLDDGAYGMIRWKQAVDDFPDFGLTFGNPDFVKYAEAYGAKGHRVEATADLVPTLEAAFQAGGVHLVAVPIDYSENTRVLVDELRAKLPAAPVSEPVSNPFDLNAMADLWRAGGHAMLNAQKEAGRAMAEGFQALGSGTVPPDLGAGSDELAKASQAMLEMWSAATGLFQTLTARLPQGGASSAAEATLRSMMDPRGWTAGGGELDDVLARMAEGPRFADLWDNERRYARVMQAWVEVRRRGLEHNAVVLEAWMAAGRAFTEEWAGHASVGGEAPDPKAALALWTETANRKLLETQRSEPFLRTQTAMIRASTDLRMAQQELVEHVGRQYGFPTRTELDDVHRSVTELKRELRAMKRAQRRAEPPALEAPPPAPPAASAPPPASSRRRAKRSA